MPSFFSNKKLIVLLVCIIILVALIGYSLNDRERISGPEQFMRDTVGWVQSIFSKPAHAVAGFFENAADIKNIYEENQVLKSRLEEYAKITVERNLLENENETLRNMIDLEESLHDYLLRPAVVIHRYPDRWQEHIGLNRGEQHDVYRDMAVIDSNGGLIGKVKRVGKFSSYVQLLTDDDPTNRVSARILSDDPETGFIESYDEDLGLIIMRKIDIDAEIELDTMVATSGLGDVYPAGLEIGKVVGAEPDEYGLTQNVFIEPTADFSALDYVYIVERTSATLEQGLLEEDD
ncbi:rod shape-determining protein MreC [Alkalihalobacillus trypoxylicola]|uniref:Cell shape-determining protein MreC n=1 Tax=Alkalihalobacillus trypoxylicola TaxID=519424 RepID=A0A162ED74_9BACI|nr:rod shape-determining protein MreC [Alkalihalobacillus trypoxylicola]KYG32311.1 rod shape-determining protein MreC [Alkalihalobacillus trypoxylicola]GAF64072.1 rod shape-determining protein MreC [Bacillus sp. TS-2]